MLICGSHDVPAEWYFPIWTGLSGDFIGATLELIEKKGFTLNRWIIHGFVNNSSGEITAGLQPREFLLTENKTSRSFGLLESGCEARVHAEERRFSVGRLGESLPVVSFKNSIDIILYFPLWTATSRQIRVTLNLLPRHISMEVQHDLQRSRTSMKMSEFFIFAQLLDRYKE